MIFSFDDLECCTIVDHKKGQLIQSLLLAAGRDGVNPGSVNPQYTIDTPNSASTPTSVGICPLLADSLCAFVVVFVGVCGYRPLIPCLGLECSRPCRVAASCSKKPCEIQKGLRWM